MTMWARRLLIWIVIASFAVFFGVDLATKGIRDIHGPQVQAPIAGTGTQQPVILQQPVPQQVERVQLVEEQLTEPAPHLHPQFEESPSLVNRMADTTGSLVRSTAQRGVEMFVSVFDEIWN